MALIEPGEVRLGRRPFSSNSKAAQQVLSTQQVPVPLREVYEEVAQPIPALEQFAGMREDGIFPVKFVSDPSFFFEHWRYTMQMKTTKKRASVALSCMEKDVSVYAPTHARVCVCVHVCMRVYVLTCNTTCLPQQECVTHTYVCM